MISNEKFCSSNNTQIGQTPYEFFLENLNSFHHTQVNNKLEISVRANFVITLSVVTSLASLKRVVVGRGGIYVQYLQYKTNDTPAGGEGGASLFV